MILYFENLVLNDISAISDLSIISSTTITDNPNLSVCNLHSICYFLSINPYPEYATINNNASGCNSDLEIENACNGLIPSNDECEGAIALTLGTTITTSNQYSTISSYIPSCNSSSFSFRSDVWFSFNSGSFSTVDVLVDGGYSLQLWEGNCASLTQVANACAESELIDISVSTNTNYYVQVWFDNSTKMLVAGDFDIVVQDGLLSTQDIAFEGFTMYPNPVNSILNFKAINNITSVEVYNLLGQQILSSTPDTLTEEINMSGFNSGMYLVKVKIGEQTATYKVVKE